MACDFYSILRKIMSDNKIQSLKNEANTNTTKKHSFFGWEINLKAKDLLDFRYNTQEEIDKLNDEMTTTSDLEEMIIQTQNNDNPENNENIENENEEYIREKDEKEADSDLEQDLQWINDIAYNDNLVPEVNEINEPIEWEIVETADNDKEDDEENSEDDNNYKTKQENDKEENLEKVENISNKEKEQENKTESDIVETKVEEDKKTDEAPNQEIEDIDETKENNEEDNNESLDSAKFFDPFELNFDENDDKNNENDEIIDDEPEEQTEEIIETKNNDEEENVEKVDNYGEWTINIEENDKWNDEFKDEEEFKEWSEDEKNIEYEPEVIQEEDTEDIEETEEETDDENTEIENEEHPEEIIEPENDNEDEDEAKDSNGIWEIDDTDKKGTVQETDGEIWDEQKDTNDTENKNVTDKHSEDDVTEISIEEINDNTDEEPQQITKTEEEDEYREEKDIINTPIAVDPSKKDEKDEMPKTRKIRKNSVTWEIITDEEIQLEQWQDTSIDEDDGEYQPTVDELFEYEPGFFADDELSQQFLILVHNAREIFKLEHNDRQPDPYFKILWWKNDNSTLEYLFYLIEEENEPVDLYIKKVETNQETGEEIEHLVQFSYDKNKELNIFVDEVILYERINKSDKNTPEYNDTKTILEKFIFLTENHYSQLKSEIRKQYEEMQKKKQLQQIFKGF